MTTATPDLNQSDPFNACYLAQLQRGAGDPRGALRVIQRATRRFPDSGLVWNDCAELLLLHKRHEDALKAAKKAIRLIPQSALPWEHLGDAHLALGRTPKAISCWEKSLEQGTHPERARVQEKIEREGGALKERESTSTPGRWKGFLHEEREHFWSIRLVGRGYQIREGEVGQKGRRKTREFSSHRAARQSARELVEEKLAEGYRGLKREAAAEKPEAAAKAGKALKAPRRRRSARLSRRRR